MIGSCIVAIRLSMNYYLNAFQLKALSQLYFGKTFGLLKTIRKVKHLLFVIYHIYLYTIQLWFLWYNFLNFISFSSPYFVRKYIRKMPQQCLQRSACRGSVKRSIALKKLQHRRRGMMGRSGSRLIPSVTYSNNIK